MSEASITVGRIVNYVLADAQVRPLLVVRPRGDVFGHADAVDGVLFFDGSNDAHALPREHPDPTGQPSMLLTAIRHDVTKNAGTWHWPEKV